MREVEHQGIIDSINGKTMRVRLEQSTACSACHANNLCSSADKQDKWIDIHSFTGTYRIGQSVVISGKSSSGLKAVALAYVFPLVLMMSGLMVSSLWLFPGKDGLAAIIALSVTMVYFLLLYQFKNALQRRFFFTVRPFYKEPAA